MRVLDDKIVYALNTSLPTESFKSKVDASSACQSLFDQIQKGHSERENVIKNCIVATAESVKKLKAAKESAPNDFDVIKNLKSEQRKVSCITFLSMISLFCIYKLILYQKLLQYINYYYYFASFKSIIFIGHVP